MENISTIQQQTKPKPFYYLGFKFWPKRQFTKSEKDDGIRLPGLRSIGISNYKGDMYKVQNHISAEWNYDDFYKAAKKAGAGKIDVFIMNMTIVVPCQNELFEYHDNVYKKPDQPSNTVGEWTKGEMKVVKTLNKEYPFEILNTSEFTTMARVTTLNKSGSAKANAARIVECWNLHDVLLSANEQLQKTVDELDEIAQSAGRKHVQANIDLHKEREENEKVKRLLHDLTPGGSEFYNDPAYCAKWIRESREENHYTLSNIIKNTKAENEALKLELDNTNRGWAATLVANRELLERIIRT